MRSMLAVWVFQSWVITVIAAIPEMVYLARRDGGYEQQWALLGRSSVSTSNVQPALPGPGKDSLIRLDRILHRRSGSGREAIEEGYTTSGTPSEMGSPPPSTGIPSGDEAESALRRPNRNARQQSPVDGWDSPAMAAAQVSAPMPARLRTKASGARYFGTAEPRAPSAVALTDPKSAQLAVKHTNDDHRSIVRGRGNLVRVSVDARKSTHDGLIRSSTVQGKYNHDSPVPAGTKKTRTYYMRTSRWDPDTRVVTGMLNGKGVNKVTSKRGRY